MSLTSILSVFKIAVGPSSSHTLGCIRIGNRFRELLTEVPHARRISAELLGSLAHTGRGHLSDLAVVAGLMGFDPEYSQNQSLQDFWTQIQREKHLQLEHGKVEFDPEADLELNTERIPLVHPNTIVFHIFDAQNTEIRTIEYHSVGGGNISGPNVAKPNLQSDANLPMDFSRVLQACSERNITICDFALEQEELHHGLDRSRVYARLGEIWKIMSDSVERGLSAEGILPGSLALPRRAKSMFGQYLSSLREWKMLAREITLASIYAIAVSEENAAGGRVVTAPTCGSAGLVPAVLRMLKERYHLADEKILEALLVAGLVGAIVVKNGSISGAEVGCQGEVGVASAMGAAAACYLLGGTNLQIEYAAEIALEHHLGLTCDPVGGLVQIPCIERNGVGAVAALNASNLAFLSQGKHRISFDDTVLTMRETGLDMNSKYKETSLGGLACRVRCGREC